MFYAGANRRNNAHASNHDFSHNPSLYQGSTKTRRRRSEILYPIAMVNIIARQIQKKIRPESKCCAADFTVSLKHQFRH
jgi:hypothetical protein